MIGRKLTVRYGEELCEKQTSAWQGPIDRMRPQMAMALAERFSSGATDGRAQASCPAYRARAYVIKDTWPSASTSLAAIR